MIILNLRFSSLNQIITLLKKTKVRVEI